MYYLPPQASGYHTHTMTPAHVISARISGLRAKGKTVKEAMDAVLGEGTYDALVSDIYTELRAMEPAGAPPPPLPTTVGGWLSHFPEPYRSAAIYHAEQAGSIGEVAGTAAGALYDAFHWHETPQGVEFWNEVFVALKEGRPLPAIESVPGHVLGAL